MLQAETQSAKIHDNLYPTVGDGPQSTPPGEVCLGGLRLTYIYTYIYSPRVLVGSPRALVGFPRALVGRPRALVGSPRAFVGRPRALVGPPWALVHSKVALTLGPLCTQMLHLGGVISNHMCLLFIRWLTGRLLLGHVFFIDFNMRGSLCVRSCKPF